MESITDDVEVIFVDNNSTDDSIKTVDSLFPEIKIIRSSKNCGFGAGCNLGSQNAKGRYLVFLNPDTVVTHGWLEELIKPLITGSNVGMTTNKILQLKNPDKINTCGNNLHLSGLSLCRGANYPKSELSDPCNVYSVSGACFAITKDLFFLLGGFDEVFFLYVEDTDISIRCLAHGNVIRYVPNSIIYHNYILKFGPLKTFYQERNRLYMMKKNFNPETLKVLKPILLITEIITFGFCLLHGKNDIKNFQKAHRWINENEEVIGKCYKKSQQIHRVNDYAVLRNLDWKIDFSQSSSKPIAFFLSCCFYPILFLCKEFVLYRLMKSALANKKE
jgi:GT2 family glycosyltransferase